MADGGGGDAGQAAEPLRGCYKEGEAYILTTMNTGLYTACDQERSPGQYSVCNMVPRFSHPHGHMNKRYHFLIRRQQVELNIVQTNTTVPDTFDHLAILIEFLTTPHSYSAPHTR